MPGVEINNKTRGSDSFDRRIEDDDLGFLSPTEDDLRRLTVSGSNPGASGSGSNATDGNNPNLINESESNVTNASGAVTLILKNDEDDLRRLTVSGSNPGASGSGSNATDGNNPNLINESESNVTKASGAVTLILKNDHSSTQGRGARNVSLDDPIVILPKSQVTVDKTNKSLSLRSKPDTVDQKDRLKNLNNGIPVNTSIDQSIQSKGSIRSATSNVVLAGISVGAVGLGIHSGIHSDSTTYGAKLVAGRLATEMAIEFLYIFRMMGVPVDGPVTLLGDNKGMIQNTSMMSSQLKKKHNAIAYHRVRECVAAGIITMGHVRSEKNYADICTKALNGPKLHGLCKDLINRK